MSLIALVVSSILCLLNGVTRILSYCIGLLLCGSTIEYRGNGGSRHVEAVTIRREAWQDEGGISGSYRAW